MTKFKPRVLSAPLSECTAGGANLPGGLFGLEALQPWSEGSAGLSAEAYSALISSTLPPPLSLSLSPPSPPSYFCALWSNYQTSEPSVLGQKSCARGARADALGPRRRDLSTPCRAVWTRGRSPGSRGSAPPRCRGATESPSVLSPGAAIMRAHELSSVAHPMPRAASTRAQPSEPSKAAASVAADRGTPRDRNANSPTDIPGVYRSPSGVLCDERGVALSFAQVRAQDNERFIEVVGEAPTTPAAFMKAVALDPRHPLDTRLKAANQAAPYFDMKMPLRLEGELDTTSTIDFAKLAALSRDERTTLLALLQKVGASL